MKRSLSEQVSPLGTKFCYKRTRMIWSKIRASSSVLTRISFSAPRRSIVSLTILLFLPFFLIFLPEYSSSIPKTEGARGSIVGWGTMLQAGRSPVRVPDEVDSSNWPNHSSRTMVLVSTQPLTEMSTRNLPAGKKRSAPRADNLAAICEPIIWKCGSLNLSQP
jgi:hypothetical protein